jgi:hypothetical protein
MKPTKLQIDIVRTVHHAKQRFRVDIKKEQVPEFLEMFLPYKRNGKHFNKRVEAAIYNLLSRKYLRKGYKESLIVTSTQSYSKTILNSAKKKQGSKSFPFTLSCWGLPLKCRQQKPTQRKE